ncbi:MAG: hypothetical protein QW190_06300, partial [Thermoproteota archaeon]
MHDNSLDTGFLVAGLPDLLRRLEEKGLFKEAVNVINRLLAGERVLPKVLRSRLEWELERIKRIEWDYFLSKEDAFKLLKEQI